MRDGNDWYRTPFGDRMRWVAGEDATAGAYSLHERVAPPGSASFPHVHSRMSEAFHVISGRVIFTIDGLPTEVSAGDFVIALAGQQHSWSVAGDEDARVLVLFAPSAGRAYFEEMHSLVERTAGRPSLEELAALSRKHGWD